MATTSAKWIAVQNKAFLYWVNSVLRKRDQHIDELASGLSNGVQLITLVEVLTGTKLSKKSSKRAVLKAHKLQNCFLALEHLKESGKVSKITISSQNLVEMDSEALLLGFCWQLLRSFQDVPTGSSGGDGGGKKISFEQGLLDWVTDLSGSNLQDGFKSEPFQNGQIFMELCNQYKPGTFDMNSFDPADRVENLRRVLTLAEEEFNIPMIIDPEELACGETSEQNLVLYLSLWSNSLKEAGNTLSREDLQKRIKELDTKIKIITAENGDIHAQRLALQSKASELSEKVQQLQTNHNELVISKEEISSNLRILKAEFASEKHANEAALTTLQYQIKLSSAGAEEQQTNLENQIVEVHRERDAMKEELRTITNTMTTENQEIQHSNEITRTALERSKKEREQLEAEIIEKQTKHGKAVHSLRKLLDQHVSDMHNWKLFLEQDKTYDSEDLHLIMEQMLEGMGFDEQIDSLDAAITEENESLSSLLGSKAHNLEKKQQSKRQIEASNQVHKRRGNRVRK